MRFSIFEIILSVSHHQDVLDPGSELRVLCLLMLTADHTDDGNEI